MILHIPHAGTNTLDAKIEDFDINELTDWYTDELFFHENANIMIQDISRFVCDVERFQDDKEDMFKLGRGICYTKGTKNNDIEVTPKNKTKIINNIYNKWHSELNMLTANTLTYFPNALIVDCHSFIDKEYKHSDFCIGTTNQTPKKLQKLVKNAIIEMGYTVSINTPFAGSMTPSNYIDDPKVYTIMLEVNKNLYLESPDFISKNSNFINIKKDIYKILDIISEFEINKE